MGRSCVQVDGRYIRWNCWHNRWVYVTARQADRFALEDALKIAGDLRGKVVPDPRPYQESRS